MFAKSVRALAQKLRDGPRSRTGVVYARKGIVDAVLYEYMPSLASRRRACAEWRMSGTPPATSARSTRAVRASVDRDEPAFMRRKLIRKSGTSFRRSALA
jgi:hypothetical protein